MEFRLLGPLEVCADGKLVALGGPKQRAILAVLLLHANEVVPRARLLAEVWGERAPGSEHSLDVHISRLRKALAPGGAGEMLVRRDRGYLLRVDEGSLDLDRFMQQIEAGQRALVEGRPAQAARLLNHGLGLWRGAPLAEFADYAFAGAEADRLMSCRLAGLEARIDADLALGHQAAVIGELESLITASPYRERFRAQLMLALYRVGRQADALTVYMDTRRLLIDELGIEPGEQLRDLHRAVLAHDPVLTPARPARPEPAEASTTTTAHFTAVGRRPGGCGSRRARCAARRETAAARRAGDDSAGFGGVHGCAVRTSGRGRADQPECRVRARRVRLHLGDGRRSAVAD